MRNVFINKRAAVVLGVFMLGCAAQQHTSKWAQTPAEPVASPRPRDIPLDAPLRDKAEQELDAAVQWDNAYIRSNAIEARQDVNDPATTPAIMQGLHDPSEVVRFSAAMAAGRLRIAKAKLELQKLLDDPNHSVQVGAIYGLYRLGETLPAHRLEHFAFDPDTQVRGNTAMVVGMLGNPTGLRVLAAMANDASWTVRLQVAESRWLLGDEDGLTDLVSGTVSKFPNEQIESIIGLAGPRDPRVAEHVRSGLTSEYAEVSLASARALGELGSDEGYGVAMAGANSADPRQRAMAAMAFGAIGRRDAQPMLAVLLRDTDLNVRVAAATAILQLK
jgi:HEAT repeat protein